MTEKSEMLHHECDPIAKLDAEIRFSDKLRALAESAHKKELPLDECMLVKLEEAGKIKARKEYE